MATWGGNIEMHVDNGLSNTHAYMNVLIDWDQQGHGRGVHPAWVRWRLNMCWWIL